MSVVPHPLSRFPYQIIILWIFWLGSGGAMAHLGSLVQYSVTPGGATAHGVNGAGQVTGGVECD